MGTRRAAADDDNRRFLHITERFERRPAIDFHLSRTAATPSTTGSQRTKGAGHWQDDRLRGDDMSETLADDERLALGPQGERKAAGRRSRRTALAAVNLNALYVFIKVAEANSFSEGARRLRSPVSTISRQVANLEMELGVRLLERSTRNVKLTGIGAEILAEACAMVEIRESVLGLISSQSSDVSGRLGIRAPPGVAHALVMPLVGAFQASYPDVRVQMTISDDAADLARGDFDLVVKIGAMKDSSLICRRILTFRDLLLASPAYLKTGKVPGTPEDLLGHRLLALSSCEPEVAWRFVNSTHGDTITVAIEPILSVNDPASLTEALLAGMGIGNLPSMSAGALVRAGQLIEVMPHWHFGERDVSLVHSSSRHVLRPVQEFIKLAARVAPALLSVRHGPDHGREGAHSSEFDALVVA
jgi:DNA-binding transcriptional LysR family regulator